MPLDENDPKDESRTPAPSTQADAGGGSTELAESGLGSGLLAQQEAVPDDQTVPVTKICPHCGTEYETVARFCPADGTALRPKGVDSLIGHVLADRYHILKRIGEGGMGRVYLGEHVKMNRQCAIKVMSPALVNDAESAARFAREASNAARIIHPNVAAVFDYGESEGVIFLVMEFVDGEPLARILKREAPLSLERAVDMAGQIADGLGAAHELGIIHRDLKPDNILVTRTKSGREVAKVVDFGIAKAIQETEGEGLTQTGHVIGTPEFMSPEQLLGDPIDARSDLYALGCIMHLMLTASPPLFAPTREQMVKRRLSEDAPTVQELDAAMPDTIARIVARLLARSPGDRYASAAEVKEALAGTHVLRNVPPSIRVTKPTPRSAPTVAFLQATQTTTEVTTIPQATPTRWLPLVIGGVVLAAVVAAVSMRSAPDPVRAERTASLSRDSVAAAANAVAANAGAANVVARPDTGPSILQPVVAAAGVPPMVDTVRQAAKAAARREHDSTAKAVATDHSSVHAPIARFAKAIESHDVAKLVAAYPGITPQQQRSWEKNFFSRTESISAPVRYGDSKVGRDTAEVDFTLMLKSVFKDKSSVRSPLRQHAILVRKGNAWEIVSLTLR
ncbi:MAG: serine/threonine-protein kinase [Gemmatimonadota bacterium]|nr:serine/threonine-protein kinase [Gemmatimonadota bacterium]